MTTPMIDPRPPAGPSIPPLRDGDRLTADEFERRFDTMPDLKKAELIDGVVYMPPPVSDEEHGGPHFDVISWLGMYRSVTPGIAGGSESTLRLDPRSRPQPDAYLRIVPESGGQARRDPGGYLVGGPELIVEVAASSAPLDLGPKLNTYQRHGVRKYIVWHVPDRTVHWFALRGDRYDPLPPDPDGVYRSEVFPGLWLDPAALTGGDVSRLVQVLQQGTATPEHAAFVARLRAAAVKGASS